RFAVDDVIKVGEVVAVIQVEGQEDAPSLGEKPKDEEVEAAAVEELQQRMEVARESASPPPSGVDSQRFTPPWCATSPGKRAYPWKSWRPSPGPERRAG